jgi:hypothetical protein
LEDSSQRLSRRVPFRAIANLVADGEEKAARARRSGGAAPETGLLPTGMIRPLLTSLELADDVVVVVDPSVQVGYPVRRVLLAEFASHLVVLLSHSPQMGGGYGFGKSFPFGSNMAAMWNPVICGT